MNEEQPFRLTREEMGDPEKVEEARRKFGLEANPDTSRDVTHGFDRKPLDYQVLAVASVNLGVGDWAVYIGSVPGQNHADEWLEVRGQGSKTSSEMAAHLFPRLAEEFAYRR